MHTQNPHYRPGIVTKSLIALLSMVFLFAAQLVAQEKKDTGEQNQAATHHELVKFDTEYAIEKAGENIALTDLLANFEMERPDPVFLAATAPAVGTDMITDARVETGSDQNKYQDLPEESLPEDDYVVFMEDDTGSSGFLFGGSGQHCPTGF
ncbi:MAG: hypothetical protein R3281_09625 [Balneolaceae bacterium]|nr:hypothetical protein [Balneolaceae bacterium]